jgi:phosphodiesterase/alkaline phosphatase D-like protein
MTSAKAALVAITVNVMAVGLLFLQPRLAFARQGSSPGQVSASPTVESVSDTLAFISWTTPNPGGTILHYAIVRYGKDPKHLDLTAKSPTRINPSHSEMVFRVRMHDLEPETTYYYKVSSEQASGLPDPPTSAANRFTTQSANQMSAKK